MPAAQQVTVLNVLHQQAAQRAKSNKPADMVKVTPTTTLENCLQLLERNKLSALPVQQGSTFIAFVTLFDILHFIAFRAVFDNKSEKATVDVGVLAKTAKDVMDFSPETSKLNVLLPQEPLSRVLSVFSSTHRALVVLDGEEQIFTQTDLLRYALDQKSLFQPNVWDMSAKAILSAVAKPGSERNPSKPVTILESTHGLTGLKKMYLHKVNAVAVVSDKGKLLASLSANDLKGLSHNNLEHLHQPVLLFLSALHRQVPTPIKCPESTSLSVIVERFMEFRAHRIWVVNAQDEPIGVITMSDVVGLLASHMA